MHYDLYCRCTIALVHCVGSLRFAASRPVCNHVWQHLFHEFIIMLHRPGIYISERRLRRILPLSISMMMHDSLVVGSWLRVSTRQQQVSTRTVWQVTSILVLCIEWRNCCDIFSSTSCGCCMWRTTGSCCIRWRCVVAFVGVRDSAPRTLESAPCANVGDGWDILWLVRYVPPREKREARGSTKYQLVSSYIALLIQIILVFRQV